MRHAMSINNITVNVKYYGVIGALAGTKYESIKLSYGSTLKDLLETLIQIKSSQFKERFIRYDTLASDIIILINNTDYRLLQDLSTPLKDGDTVTIISVVHGGA
jgi:molybdopterin converting factor small subunit